MKAQAWLKLGIIVFIFAVVIFIFEFAVEVVGIDGVHIPWVTHEILELFILFGLLLGVLLILISYRLIVQINQALETSLKIASGDLQAGLEELFESWQLSDSERDVALMTIKGASLSDISRLRETAIGTVKTQSSAVYRKAGVNTRAQLVSLVIEELLR